MTITRRFLLQGGSALSLYSVAELAHGQVGQRLPNPTTFQSGDLVWPKKPGSFVPYRYESGQSADEDRERWEREKAEFLEKVRKGERPDGQRAAQQIANLSYDEFRARYLRNLEVNQIAPFSLGGVAAVGHVAIIEVDSDNQPWIIEALWTPGVVRQRYSSWIDARLGEIVWHGRLKDVSPQERAKIPLEERYLGKPYDFWNFNLADDAGFYCSKLVWLSVLHAVNIAVDNNSNPVRPLWLSPKQVLYSSRINRLFDPGAYA